MSIGRVPKEHIPRISPEAPPYPEWPDHGGPRQNDRSGDQSGPLSDEPGSRTGRRTPEEILEWQYRIELDRVLWEGQRRREIEEAERNRRRAKERLRVMHHPEMV